MTITNYEMKRRGVVLEFRSRITDVLGEFVADGSEGITYAEALKALHEAMGRLVGELIVEEWREQNQE